MVEDRGGLGLAALEQQTDDLVRKLQKQPGLVGVSTQFRSNTPQLYMDIDRTKVASLGVSLERRQSDAEIYLGSLYVNSFNAFGRHWQVNVQAEGDFRTRSTTSTCCRSATIKGRWSRWARWSTSAKSAARSSSTATTSTRPPRSAGTCGRAPAPARSSPPSTTLAAKTLPLSMKTEWTELMFMQIRAGNTAMYVFGLAVVCVFLALAALYESWSLPLAVILVVPLCLLCSVVGVLLTTTIRSTSSCRSAWWCWSDWRARTRS